MRTLLSATFATALFALTGCGAGFRYGPVEPIDLAHQTCVDAALQRNPDPALFVDAVARFEAGCDQGDPAACSLLGLMHERGLSVKPDQARARALYTRACDAGNKLGCAHLSGTAAPPPISLEFPPFIPTPPDQSLVKR